MSAQQGNIYYQWTALHITSLHCTAGNCTALKCSSQQYSSVQCSNEQNTAVGGSYTWINTVSQWEGSTFIYLVLLRGQCQIYNICVKYLTAWQGKLVCPSYEWGVSQGGDSIWKHQEKHDTFFLDFLFKKWKVFDILVIHFFLLFL